MKRKLFITMGVMMVFLFTSCAQENPAGKEGKGEEKMPRIEGKKVLMLIASRNFRDEEYQKPKKVFEEQGGMVTTASSSLEESRGKFGTKVKPDLLLGQVKAEDYEAIIFVGGTGASEYWENEKALSLAKKAVELNKVVGAICIAPVTLANAGILEGKKATVFGSEEGRLTAKGAIYTGKDVEREGNIITGNGPQAAEKFGEEIVNALGEKGE